MQKLSFKRASQADIDGILKVMQRVGYLDFRFPNQPKDKIKKQLISELKDRTILVCCSRKKVIGYSIFGPAEKFLKCPIKISKKDHAFSLGIGIDPDYQRKSIGKKLVDYSKKIATKQGFKGAYGDIASNNRASLKIQKSAGFIKIAEYDDAKRPKGIKNILVFKKFI